VATVVERLRAIQPHRGVLAQREAAGVWAPFYDRMVGLFLETVTGSPPTLAGDGGSDGMRSPVTGGWPCQVYPAGWRERAATLLAEMEAARAKHAYAQLREFLRRCVDAPGELTGREVGRIRLIVARSVAKRGMPDSAECRAARTAQARDVAAPMHHEVAKVVAGRLEGTGSRKAIENLSAMTRALDDAEAVRAGVMPGTSLPPSIVRRVERCWLATVEELVAREVIVSGEVLARVLPQMTSGVRAAGITDDRLRSVYAEVYRAFRRRRSLLLLNLESQVKVEELPWVAAIERFRQRGDGDLSPRDASRRALTEVAALTLTAFPQAIVPNKLLRELRELAKGAELDLPLVEEVAADIFMGQFSGQFVKAARAAADLMSGMLYARYYAIDYDTARRLPVLEKEELARSRNAGRWSDPFAEFCAARAGVTVGSVVDNGMTIEQQQIVTTQNLAVLVGGLGLRAGLGERFGDLARRCFVWVCRRLQVKADGRHAQLIALKNTAYAWRQMVFFLSMMTQEEVAAFVGVARGHLAEQRAAFGQRFEPAMRGLELAVAGETLDEETRARHGVRQFVGWVKGTHWLAG
jgi:hypothetical protein